MANVIDSFEKLKNVGLIGIPLSVSLSQILPDWYNKLQKGEIEIVHLISDAEIIRQLYTSDRDNWHYFEEANVFIGDMYNDVYYAFSGDATRTISQFTKALIHESKNDQGELPRQTSSSRQKQMASIC